MFDGGLMGIGEMARASGLPVSALRFYDGARLLVPVRVDPATGYRRYGREQVGAARLLARLRRVGMPLAEMRVLVANRHDRAVVGALVAEHLARLAAGLADARRELEYVMSDIDPTGTAFRVATTELRRALASVRFALPAAGPADLDAILFEVSEDRLTLVATDRYRLAVAAVPVGDRSGPAGRLSVPRVDLDRLGALPDGTVDGRIDGDVLRLGGLTVTAHPGGFPAYQMVTEAVAGQRITVDAAELRARLADGPVRRVPDCPGPVAALGLDPTGALRVVDETGGGFVAAVNRDYLIDALDAVPAGQLVLHLDGPLHPLAVRHPADPDTYSVLMPVRLP